MLNAYGEGMAKNKHQRETRFVSQISVMVPDASALIEMMRYDSCYPASEPEAHKIMRLISGSVDPTDRLIRLTRVARNDLPPTEGRWRSFACRVLDVRHPDDSPITDAELINLNKIGFAR